MDHEVYQRDEHTNQGIEHRWNLAIMSVSRQLGVGEEITIPPQRLTDTTLTLPIKYQMHVDALNDVLLSLACGDPLEPLVR